MAAHLSHQTLGEGHEPCVVQSGLKLSDGQESCTVHCTGYAASVPVGPSASLLPGDSAPTLPASRKTLLSNGVCEPPAPGCALSELLSNSCHDWASLGRLGPEPPAMPPAVRVAAAGTDGAALLPLVTSRTLADAESCAPTVLMSPARDLDSKASPLIKRPRPPSWPSAAVRCCSAARASVRCLNPSGSCFRAAEANRFVSAAWSAGRSGLPAGTPHPKFA